MKKLLLLVIPIMLLTLAGCSKAETENKEQEKSNQEEQKEEEQETNEQKEEQEKNTDGLNQAKPIEEMTPEEYDTYLLTQKRSYLTKEQQKRYDELLEMKGSTPAENDEKNQAYNNKKRNELEGNGGGTALITPPETEKEKEELRKRQEKQLKQKQAESDNTEQSQSLEQQEQQQTQQEPQTQETQQTQQTHQQQTQQKQNTEQKVIEPEEPKRETIEK
ncbi:hypothetical protein [Staphylococcus equorum]|uniref:hypothetical protein n=1 Tax=Staphylococcus equorum TaxID=246432 RepID=UPI00192D173E|nr:hypothetical protein [Staphylococcus equorum]